MKTLLDLHVTIGAHADVASSSSHSHFTSLAHEIGLDVVPLRLESPDEPDNLHRILDQLHLAQGFWIRDPALMTDLSIRSAVETRLSEGAVAIAQLGWQTVIGAEWFESLGLEPTSVRAVRASTAPAISQPQMLVLVERDKYDFGFRDPVLFHGVREILLQQANGIGCFQDAQVVLAIPSFAIELLDSRSDVFIDAVPRAELPVVASASRPDWRGRVIAFHAGVFHDKYAGPLGDEFPGIEAADNERLARNLLQVVAAGVQPALRSWENAYALIDDIETAIARLTNHVLRARAGSDWFETCVPAKIREKCQQKQRGEGSRFPVTAYLELIDYKVIWKENWVAFEPLLSAYEAPASKTRSLEFFQKINPVRILAAHATKRFFGGLAAPTDEELDVLRRAKARVLALTARAKAAS